MDIDDLRSKSHIKILFRGFSGTGKTLNSCIVALEVAKEGGRVKYIDTEDEGSETIVDMVDSGWYDSDLEGEIEYTRVTGAKEFFDEFPEEDQCDWDLVVVDTLDHKHTYALRVVTDERKKSDVNWNQFPAIYDAEKSFMQAVGQPDTHIVASIDPESGKSDKPKGTQVNVDGYFDIVVRLQRGDNVDWEGVVENFVGDLDNNYIGKKASGDNLRDFVRQEVAGRVIERSDL